MLGTLLDRHVVAGEKSQPPVRMSSCSVAARSSRRTSRSREVRAQREAGAATVGLDRQDLVHPDVGGFEAAGGGGEIEAPGACAGQPCRRYCSVPAVLEVGHPAAQGEAVVLSQALDVADLETDHLHGRDDRADFDQLAVGKHVPVDEVVTVGTRPKMAESAAKRPGPVSLGPREVADGVVDKTPASAHTATKS